MNRMNSVPEPLRPALALAPWALPLAAALLAAGLMGGCQNNAGAGSLLGEQATHGVPDPINLTLPHAIVIHPFTGANRTFDPKGGIKGIEVQIMAKDAYGDATKAYGDFKFELYEYKNVQSDPRGERIAVWEASVEDGKDNRVHWSELSRMYEFRLQWGQAVPVGQKLVLTATFSSRYTDRLFNQYVFAAGE